MSLTDLLERRRTIPLPTPAECRRLREVFNLSQGDIARELGVTPPTISRWESGDRQPTGEQRSDYAALLRELADRERQPNAS